MRFDAREGVAAIATDGESGWNLYGPVWSVGQDAPDSAVPFLDEAGGLPTHSKGEAGEASGLGCDEVEEVPLRHERDEFGVGGEVREIGHRDAAIADKAGEAGDLRVGNGEKSF